MTAVPTPSPLDAGELELLQASAADHTIILYVVVTSCRWTCCGRGWQVRDGYEQEYWGYADDVKLWTRTDPNWSGKLLLEPDSTFMLYNPGIGAPSYVIACKTADIALVERAR